MSVGKLITLLIGCLGAKTCSTQNLVCIFAGVWLRNIVIWFAPCLWHFIKKRLNWLVKILKYITIRQVKKHHKSGTKCSAIFEEKCVN